MVAPVQPRWIRSAAIAILTAWLPCVPLGLCAARAAAQPARHGCCHQQAAARMTPAPEHCRIQSAVPAPAAPPQPANAPPVVVAAQGWWEADGVALERPRPTAFSPLAIVLRI